MTDWSASSCAHQPLIRRSEYEGQECDRFRQQSRGSEKFDYFTYNNILGRSGRMFEHFVGHVYVFREPPAQELPLIDFPIFPQPGSFLDSLLVQSMPKISAPDRKKRLEALEGQDHLSMDLIKQSHGVDHAGTGRVGRRSCRRMLLAIGRNCRGQLTPTGAQMKAVCALIWQFFHRR